MNSSNTPASGDTPLGDTTVVAPDKAANEATVDAPPDPKIDNDSGDKVNASSTVTKFRITDKRGTRR
jgi:hypothetical protein